MLKVSRINTYTQTKLFTNNAGKKIIIIINYKSHKKFTKLEKNE